jgi:hypothetical protein
MDNKEKKHGFSGLSDLASKVSDVDDVACSEPKSEAKSPSSTTEKKPERKSPISSPTIETVSSDKRSGNSGWRWILGIVGVVVVIWITNNGGRDTKKSSPNMPSPTHNTYEVRPNRDTLAGEIENGKLRAKTMEVQIKDMDGRLEDFERRMSSYRASGMTDEYNMLVPSHNSLVGRRNDIYEEYSLLIDEVNAKVKRYNAGYR